MTSKSFEEILSQAKWEENSFATTIGDNWMQGRAIYGGLTAALAAHGMRKNIPEDRFLRSLMVNFVGPAKSKDLTIKYQTLRSGGSVTNMRADVIADGEVMTSATGVFGKNREAISYPTHIKMPSSIRPAEGEPYSDHPTVPRFIREFQSNHDHDKFFKQKLSRMGMWVRHNHEFPAYPVEKIIALIDRPVGIIMSHTEKPGMLSSASWAVEVVKPFEEIIGDWFYLDCELKAAANGYSQQSINVFTENGTLIALSQQCMAYYG